MVKHCIHIAETVGPIPTLPTRQKIASFQGSLRFARRPNHKVFEAEKSVGDSAFLEKKFFNRFS